MLLNEQKAFDTKKYLAIFGVIFGLVFVRYCYFGFEYYNQLDDYIQYHNYTAFNDDLWAYINVLGLLGSRPLAGLADLFVWSHFYEFMIVAVAIISAMYAASAVLFHKVFHKHFGTGMMFFVIFALLPMGFEGLYWVSASTRIVVGIFFAALSLYFFDKWCDGGKKSSLVLFAVLQFIGFCFYEQIILLSGGATIVLMVLYWKKSGKRALWGFLMFVSAVLYLAITTFFASEGSYGSRTELFLPLQEGWLTNVAVPAGEQILDASCISMWSTLSKGFIRGMAIAFSQPSAIICTIVIAGLCVLFFFIAKNTKRSSTRITAELISGVFLLLAPFVIFFIIKAPWISIRNLAPSLLGLALICDGIFGLIFGKMKNGSLVQAIICAVLALFLSIASASELYDYRQIYLADTKITEAAGKALDGVELQGEQEVWLMNIDASYLENANFFFNEHGHGVSASDWALTGAVRANSGDGSIAMLTPVSVHRALYVENPEHFKNVLAFVYIDGEFVQADITASTGNNFEITSLTGELLGELITEDGQNYDFIMF